MRKFRFKTVRLKDCNLLFNWRNEREVRMHSFNKEKINLKKHKVWLKNQLKKKSDYFWFFMLNQTKVGLVRLKLKSKTFMLNYMISKDFRKKKLAKKMLIKMLKKIKQKKLNKSKIIAQITHDNVASKKSLLASGFKIQKKGNKHTNLEYLLK